MESSLHCSFWIWQKSIRKVQLVYHEWDGRMAFKVNGKIRKNTIGKDMVRLDYKNHRLIGCSQYWTEIFPIEKILEFNELNYEKENY